jgi:hypothetical protein
MCRTGRRSPSTCCDLAARNGQLSSVDPITGKLLQDIRSAVAGGSLQNIDANLERFTFNIPVESARHYPTFRLDYNLSQKHRASFAYNYQKFTDVPDTLNNFDQAFPGFPVAAGQSAVRLGWSGTVRSTVNANLVNEARLGYSGAPVSFFSELNPDMYNGSVANQAGFQLNFPTVGSQLTSPSANAQPQSRNANSLLIDDSINWLKGSHSFSIGGTFTQYDIWARTRRCCRRSTSACSATILRARCSVRRTSPIVCGAADRRCEPTRS